MKFDMRFHTRFGCLSMFVSLSTVMQTLCVFAIIKTIDLDNPLN